jgi:seryl-tRNA synthetase
MAYTQQQAVDQLTKTNETLAKVSNETDSLVAANKKLQEELANAGGPGGTITDELANAIKATDDRVNAIDALVADVPQPEGAKK